MHKVTELWAYVADGYGDEGEGICAIRTGTGFVPLVGADAESMKFFKLAAQQVADAGQKQVRLLRFTTREEVELLDPRLVDFL